jgi:hypothetical protein
MRLKIAATLVGIAMSLFGAEAQNLPPTPSAVPIHTPPPPHEVGCFVYRSHPADGAAPRWTKIPCLPAREASHLPHMKIGDGAGVYGLNGPENCLGDTLSGTGAFPACNGATYTASPVTAAAVSAGFPNNGFGAAPFFGITDSGTGRASFSVQTNTNTFAVTCHPGSEPPGQDICVTGDTGWVQFAYQFDPGPVGTGLFNLGVTSALCIWNVDLTQQKYPNWCTSVPDFSETNWAAGPVEVMGGESNQSLWIMMCPPWTPGDCWSAAAPDALGLCWDFASSQCAWLFATGSLLSEGNSGNASFPSGTSLETVVQTSSCTPPSTYDIPFHPFPTQAMGIPVLQEGLAACPTTSAGWISGFPGPPISDNTTNESNNLTPKITPASSLVPACFEGTCWIDYISIN